VEYDDHDENLLGEILTLVARCKVLNSVVANVKAELAALRNYPTHNLSEFPYTPSPIDREDEPLFACDLSEVRPTFDEKVSFHHPFTKPRFSSLYLAKLHRGEILPLFQHGLLDYDIAFEQKTKPLSHGQRFTRSIDWATRLKKRDESCADAKTRREREREEKEFAREAEWQRELATWPQFVPYQAVVADEPVITPRVVDYLATVESPRTCKHRLREFTFSDGAVIKKCSDCTQFDTKRQDILKQGKIKQVRSLRWEEKLEAEGLPQNPPHNPIVSTYKSRKAELEAIEHAQASEGRSSSAKKQFRASQIRKDAKTNTEPQRNCEECGVRFVPNHAGRKHCSDNCRKQHFKKKQRRRFPHTLTMPRALKNFCPRCSTYATADHECQGNQLQRAREMREQERKRIMRDAALTLSNPNILAPSMILKEKGGYGKN
jgi:hypothetical protein